MTKDVASLICRRLDGARYKCIAANDSNEQRGIFRASKFNLSDIKTFSSDDKSLSVGFDLPVECEIRDDVLTCI